ncbi:MAG: hypothetical protein MUC50_12245 [Myxococcota bacterium]|nr:hypothetical protein [Myxococcota bacterium]
MSLKWNYSLAVCSFIALFIGITVSLDGFAAVDLSGKEVFKHTTRVSKSYKAKMYFRKNVLVELKTDTPAGQATDPVMFLLSETVDSSGRPVVRKASDDMAIGVADARLTHTSTTGEWMTVIVVAYDSDYVGTTNLLIKIGSAAAETVPIWAGGTVYKTGWYSDDTFTLTGHYNDYTLESMCVDKIGKRPGNISTTWDDYNMTCNSRFTNASGVVKNVPYQGNQICAQAAPYHLNSDGESIPTVYNWINPANPTCQYVSNATDSFALAVGDWAKIMESCEYSCIYPPYSRPICTPYNCVEVNLPPKAMAMDDDSGTGRHFRLTTAEYGSPEGVVIAALSPWVTQYKAYYDNPAAGDLDEKVYAALADDECSRKWRDYFSQWRPNGAFGVLPTDCPGGAEGYLLADNAFRPYVRLYHDHSVQVQANDDDHDGLSNDIEDVLGTSPTDNDHDNDGIIDGLEVYGPLVPTVSPNASDPIPDLQMGRFVGAYFPLPLYGTDPKVKDVIFEMDTQEYVLNPPEITTGVSEGTKDERMRSLEAAGEAFDLANIHLIFVLDGPNRNTVIPDNTLISYPQSFWKPTGNGPPWKYPLIDMQRVDDPEWWALNIEQLELDIAPTHFDLFFYPFVRYGAFVATVSADRRLCGLGMVTKYKNPSNWRNFHGLPLGRYMLLSAIKHVFADADGNRRSCMNAYDGTKRRIGGATTHEIGHTMGLGHNGPGWGFDYQYAQNHWSIMSYGFSLPVEQVQVKNAAGAWTTQNIRADLNGDGVYNELFDGVGDCEVTPGTDVCPLDGVRDDLPFFNQQSRGWAPPHFSMGAAMVDIDETNLVEANGLSGTGSRVVFKSIRDCWTQPDTNFSYAGELGVTWVDWDRNRVNNGASSRTNLTLVKRQVMFRAGGDFDGDGVAEDDDGLAFIDRQGNCYRSSKYSDSKKKIEVWANAITGERFSGSEAQYESLGPAVAAFGELERRLPLSHDSSIPAAQRLPTKTFNNETDYLKEADMSPWSWGAEGYRQSMMVGAIPLEQNVFPLTTPTPVKTTADIPWEAVE